MTRVAAELSVGQSGRVARVAWVSDDVSRRLLEMGVTPGVELRCIGAAPLGDPLEFELRGYRLSLRRRSAEAERTLNLILRLKVSEWVSKWSRDNACNPTHLFTHFTYSLRTHPCPSCPLPAENDPRCPGRQSEHWQEHAVHCTGWSSAANRQLSGRHGREEDRPSAT